MKIIAAAVVLAALAVSDPAAARHRGALAAHPDCNVLWPCEGVAPSPRGLRTANRANFGSAVQVYSPEPVRKGSPSPRNSRRLALAYAPPQSPVEAPGRSAGRLAGVLPALAAKVGEIVATCGSRVVSTVRRTFVAGTRTVSLHASGRAVDIAGNPGCAYSLLRGWPGGYSVDYAAVRHIHLSLGGREDGVRFVHGGGHRHHRHRHHHRIG
jgi:hypothetical protein